MKKLIASAGLVAGLSLSALLVSTSAWAANHEVSIQGFKFSPASLTVAVGDTVTFTNNDSAPHTATSAGFDTGTLKNGESKSVNITAAGSQDYKCKFHPAMKGNVTAN